MSESNDSSFISCQTEISSYTYWLMVSGDNSGARGRHNGEQDNLQRRNDKYNAADSRHLKTRNC
jgi:hypothetical protein